MDDVTKGNPAYVEHYKPQLPADLGFYELRIKESSNVKHHSLGAT